jgi:hypothetical protein
MKILGEALTEFVDSLEDSNDDDASQNANEARYFKIIASFSDAKVLDKATSKQLVSSFYALAEFLLSDLPNKYEDLMPGALDSFFLVGDEEADIFEAFEIIGHEKFPASEIDSLIRRHNVDEILELGYTSPVWLQTKVLKRQQYFDLWELNLSQEFSEGFHLGLVQNPMTPKQLLLEASESCYYSVRRKICHNPKADEIMLRNVLVRGDYEKPEFKENRIDKKYFAAYERFMASSSVVQNQFGGAGYVNQVIQSFKGVETILPTVDDMKASLAEFYQLSGFAHITWDKFFVPAVRDKSVLEFDLSNGIVTATITNEARVNSPGRVQPGKWSCTITQANTAEIILKYWLIDAPEINTVVQWHA